MPARGDVTRAWHTGLGFARPTSAAAAQYGAGLRPPRYFPLLRCIPRYYLWTRRADAKPDSHLGWTYRVFASHGHAALAFSASAVGRHRYALHVATLVPLPHPLPHRLSHRLSHTLSPSRHASATITAWPSRFLCANRVPTAWTCFSAIGYLHACAIFAAAPADIRPTRRVIPAGPPPPPPPPPASRATAASTMPAGDRAPPLRTAAPATASAMCGCGGNGVAWDGNGAACARAHDAPQALSGYCIDVVHVRDLDRQRSGHSMYTLVVEPIAPLRLPTRDHSLSRFGHSARKRVGGDNQQRRRHSIRHTHAWPYLAAA